MSRLAKRLARERGKVGIASQTVFRSKMEPLVRGDGICDHPLSAKMHHGDRILRFWGAMVGGLFVPAQRFLKIQRDAFALMIAASQIILRQSMSFFRGAMKPCRGGFPIFLGPFALVIKNAEVAHRIEVALSSGLSKPAQRQDGVALNARIFVIHLPEPVLRLGKSELRRLFKPADGQWNVFWNAFSVVA